MTLFGWDASDFDWDRGPMDVAAAAADGISFFTHKATESTNVTHGRFGTAVARARDAGIPFVGAYWVPRTPGNGGAGSIAAQVDFFLSYVDEHAGWWRDFDGWFFQVDLEHWGYDNVAPVFGVQGCELVRQRTGRAALLYAPAWAYGNAIGGADPLWASNYGGNPAVGYRDAYPGDSSTRWAAYSGRSPVILQFGSRCTIGRQPGCDANAFRGSLDDFAQLIGGLDMASLENVERMLTEMYPYGRGALTGRDPGSGAWLTDSWDGAVLPGTRQLAELGVAILGAVKAGEAADATRDAATLAALSALGNVIQAGGGSVDVAAIKGFVDAAAAASRTQMETLHTENTGLKAQVTGLEAKVADLTTKLATGAQAEADALKP